jgi:hypothetical protein
MESNWPEHTPEPDEPPRWRGWAIGIGVIVAIALLLPRDANWLDAWQMPSISMPEMEMPDINLRGRSDETPAEAPAPQSVEVSEGIAVGEPSPDGAPVVEQVSFERCLRIIENTASTLNAAPALLEDTSDRRAARFKVIEGSLTLTCSRPDGTLTIEQSR